MADQSPHASDLGATIDVSGDLPSQRDLVVAALVDAYKGGAFDNIEDAIGAAVDLTLETPFALTHAGDVETRCPLPDGAVPVFAIDVCGYLTDDGGLAHGLSHAVRTSGDADKVPVVGALEVVKNMLLHLR